MRRVAYKYRIYPNDAQVALIQRTFGCARLVWNLMLDDAKKSYQETKKFTWPTPAAYKDEYPFLRKVDSMALCNAQMNLNAAFSRFFKDRKKKSGRKNRFPKRKKKHKTRKSYTTNNIKSSVRIDYGKLRLPKVGLLQTVLHRRLEGKIKSATVSQDPSGKYYVSVLTEQPDLPQVEVDHNKVIGLDFSFPSLYVDQTGARPKLPEDSLRKLEKKLAREQRRLSKKQFRSNGYQRQKRKVALVYEKIRNIRRDACYKTVKQILDDYDVVIVEDIDLVAMSRRGRRRKFGRTIYRRAFGLFRTVLQNKAEAQGKVYIVADRWFPSTQKCNKCDYINKATKDLSVRTWICPGCNTEHDRDQNSAQNLVNYYHQYIRTGALPGSYADGDCAPTSSRKAKSKRGRRTRKSCETGSHKPLSLRRGR